MSDEGPEYKSEHNRKKPTGQEPYQDLFQDAIERVARLDSNAQFLSVNKQFADLFGYHSSEMIGMSLAELCVSDECTTSIDLFVEMKTKGRSEGLVKANTRAGDEFHLKLLLIKGIQKSDSSYFCYCIVDLVNPAELANETRSDQVGDSALEQPYLTDLTLQQREQKYRNLIE